jgi:ABC-type polysaccharide/polyol phosphate transport system ATPase subunit
MEPVIELRNITKRFDMRQESSSLWRFLMRKPAFEESNSATHKVVLDNISLSIQQGERLAIIGRNGAGKSTLLKIISRILQPDSGTIAVRGTISSLLELGVGFHPELTGADNIYFYGALMGKNRAQVLQVYDEICEFADIGNYIQQPVKTYSSGMYQRLAFACAFAMQPSILIADEGLSVGDFLFQQKCFDRIDQIVSEGTTFLMVAHSARQVQRIATRGIWLENGRIEMDGDINEVQDAYTKFLLYEKSLLASSGIIDDKHMTTGLELEYQSGDPNAVQSSQSMVSISNVTLAGTQDPWRSGRKSFVYANVTTNLPEIAVRVRGQIVDVSDDIPLVENRYMHLTPMMLTQGVHTLKFSIPPILMKRGTYRFVIEVFDEKGQLSLAKSQPLILQSKFTTPDAASAYMQHPRLLVEVTTEEIPAPTVEE